MADAGTGGAWLREAGLLALTLVGLVAGLGFEHWVVHRQMILPALDAGGYVLPWMWGALYAPELVIAFVAGWRLRSPSAIAVYAGAAAVVREGFELWLARIGEPGHAVGGAPVSEFVFATPLVALAYIVVLALAAVSGQSDEALDGSFAERR